MGEPDLMIMAFRDSDPYLWETRHGQTKNAASQEWSCVWVAAAPVPYIARREIFAESHAGQEVAVYAGKNGKCPAQKP